MTVHQAKPITIRGVQYSSIREAAKDLGINSATVSLALKRGHLDQLIPKSETGRWMQESRGGMAALMGIRKTVRTVIDRGSLTSCAHMKSTTRKRVSVAAVSILDGKPA